MMHLTAQALGIIFSIVANLFCQNDRCPDCSFRFAWCVYKTPTLCFHYRCCGKLVTGTALIKILVSDIKIPVSSPPSRLRLHSLTLLLRSCSFFSEDWCHPACPPDKKKDIYEEPKWNRITSFICNQTFQRNIFTLELRRPLCSSFICVGFFYWWRKKAH